MIKTYYHTGEGYNPFLIREGWQVAQLNYLPKHGFDDIDDVEVHKSTDEVFILFKGQAVLIAVDLDEMKFECVNMKPGVTYNISAGVWHNIAMNKEAEMIIVEKSFTHNHDCEHLPLDEKQRNRLYKNIAETRWRN